MVIVSCGSCINSFNVLINSRHSKTVTGCRKWNHNIWWSTTSHAPRTLTQNPEAVRAGNYRDCFVNQAHPWLLLVNSHTHPWNSWKRTLLVWLCRSAYCNYVAFNCALLTPSDWDELWPGTEMSLLFADLRPVWKFMFCYKDSFSIISLFPRITVELQWKRRKSQNTLAWFGFLCPWV